VRSEGNCGSRRGFLHQDFYRQFIQPVRRGQTEKVTLGMDLAGGERPVVAVPGGCRKAIRLRDGARYALMANTLSPEFTPDRVRIGEGAVWLKRFKGKTPWASETMLRELIGPNWKP
jgi:predicted cupin superfamily sugar epimerase